MMRRLVSLISIRVPPAAPAARRDAIAWRLTPGELGAAEAAAAAWRPALAGADSTTPPEAQLVVKVQSLLTTLGFDPGPADGAMRHRTAQAIRDYQEKLGLAVDGQVSEALLGHLEKVTGAGG